MLSELDTHLLDPVVCKTASISELEWCVQGPPGTGACKGDSGSPVLKQVGTAWQILGIASRVTSTPYGPCVSASVYTNTNRYLDWVTSYTGPLPTS
jgi:secreted trypsin-like serine protease